MRIGQGLSGFAFIAMAWTGCATELASSPEREPQLEAEPTNDPGSAGYGDGASDETLIEKSIAVVATRTISFSVKTGDRDNAATNANPTIWYHVVGEKTWRYRWRSSVSRNSTWTESDTIPESSWIDQIDLAHNNTGAGPGWYVDYVKIDGRTCTYNMWLEKTATKNTLEVYCNFNYSPPRLSW